MCDLYHLTWPGLLRLRMSLTSLPWNCRELRTQAIPEGWVRRKPQFCLQQGSSRHPSQPAPTVDMKLLHTTTLWDGHKCKVVWIWAQCPTDSTSFLFHPHTKILHPFKLTPQVFISLWMRGNRPLSYIYHPLVTQICPAALADYSAESFFLHFSVHITSLVPVL